MTEAGSEAVLAPSGNARRGARRPHRRVGLLLTGVAVCGVAVASHGEASPILRTVMVGGDPEQSLTVDDQTSRAFVFNRFNNTVSVLDTATGALVRTVSVGASFAFFAIDRPTGHVFLGSGGDGTISMLDAHTGRVMRTVTDPDNDVRRLAVDERTNRVFVGGNGNAVTVLDGRTGAILQHLAVCGGPFAVGVSERTGHLFAKCNDGTTDMFDARSGRVLHHNPTNSGAYCSVVVDERTDRVVETGNSSADLLDAHTGRILRRWAFPASPATLNFCLSTAVDTRRGWIYTILDPSTPGFDPSSGLSATNQVAALDGRTGAILHRFPVPGNANALVVDSQTGHVLVDSVGPLDRNGFPTANGTVSILDGATGRVLRTLPVGFAPSDMAVDVLHRRAVVVSSYSDVNGNGNLVTWRPRESWWPQMLRRIAHVICCLPFRAPAPPAPTTDGTVTTIDLTRL